MSNPLVRLAEYLTDSRRVVKTSVNLQVGGDSGRDAEDFYALRNAFNIRGYATSGEALEAIKATLNA